MLSLRSERRSRSQRKLIRGGSPIYLLPTSGIDIKGEERKGLE